MKIRAERVVRISDSFLALIEGPFRWQVCFQYNNMLSSAGKQIDPDLHDWLLENTQHEIKVLTQSIWFENEEEACLCLMRFSHGQ